MKYRLLIGLCVVALCAGCQPARPVLRLYNWADYIKPDLLSRFEEETGCRIVVDTFDSNETMLAKLKQNITRYDLVFPSDYFLPTMKAQGMLQPIQRRLVPNMKHLDPDHLKMLTDQACDFSVPYMVSKTGIAYRKSRLADARSEASERAKPTWQMLDRPEVKGQMTLLDDVRETVGAALKMLGYSLNTTNDTELAAARDVVLRWKKNSARFDNEGYVGGITTGGLVLAHGYSGSLFQAEAENKDIVYVEPEEGGAMSYDLIVIPGNARQVELAHRFINFLHDPAVAAENTEFILYLCPNKDSYDLLSPDMKTNPAIFPPPGIRSRSEVIRDLGPDNVKYDRLWDQIKSAP
ncbi:MAG: spermidine/putrescine ABC transporter substrate-binding protein [Verrucomicrobia bacterium]|nr:spermidine/putrescine ABC transporter substrate-binding protein [Verrucomicrobiota bacterium]MCG2679047.1 spermidine/putrescine ABC transporter substrate-binding protein [Kiritimatiellia bacterium]MBU4247573.1 spermidine/putrescine ABC transporter substrate-binding protein [Verrucomicrobiota bacterium]MBU4291187.1 spermidine/putrescine ABC transporter substrate-binding protein [Verrucomicrobiota bacterium]MBU4428470.1 spermidine/putrescine ABC transporter substrate-binding protein [Verrucomi